MSSGIYNRFKYNCFSGAIDVESPGDTVKCALLTSSHAFDADNNVWSDISANEVSGTGYVAGGETLIGMTVTQDDTNDLAKFDGDDVTWSSSTITARFAVLYNTTVSDNLIACFDFTTDKSSSNGNFTIEWHADGIITLS